MTTTVARWESRSGKHWVELEQFESGGYGYIAPGAGGSCGRMTYDEAIAYVERLVAMGDYFQPAANKTPMHRVHMPGGEQR